MFKRKFRLKKSADILDVYSARKMINGENLRLHFDFKATPTSPLVTAVTSKKVGIAVVRNKMRRRIYSILRRSKISQIPNLRLVIVCKPSIAKLTFAQIQTEIIDLLNRIKY